MAISNRICLQCGKPLASDEASCSNCGARYPEPSTVGTLQSAAAPPWNAFQAEQPTQVAFNTFPFAGEQRPLPALAIPASADGNPSAVAEERPGPSATAGRRLPGGVMIIGALLLVVLLLGGSLYFLLNSKTSTSGTPLPASISNPKVQPMFSDIFADNTRGWSTGSGAGYSSTISNNALTLMETNHRIIAEPIPDNNSAPATFTDCTVTTTFTILKADQNDSVGLYLRGDGSLKSGYFIDIFGDNSYDIVKVFPDGRQDAFLVSPTPSGYINAPGQQNRLMVIMKGAKMMVYMNNRLVASLADSRYSGGQIALFAENGSSSNGINATFSNVTVYPAPLQLPG